MSFVEHVNHKCNFLERGKKLSNSIKILRKKLAKSFNKKLFKPRKKSEKKLSNWLIKLVNINKKSFNLIK